MSKIQKHLDICEKLTLIYVDKNSDYGDSFGDTFNKLGMISAVTRITDKTKEEFEKACKVRGLATVDTVKDYIKRHDKNSYTEDDLIDVYRKEENAKKHINTKHRSFYELETDNYAQIKDDK